MRSPRQRQLGLVGPHALLSSAVVLMVAVFATDLLTPFGFPHGMFYVPVVLLAMSSGRQRALIWISCLCLALNAVGWMLSPSAPVNHPTAFVVVSRVASMLVLVMFTGVALLYLRHARRLQRERAESNRRGHLLEIAGELGQLGAWEFDVKRRLMIWSPEVARLHGRSPGYSPSFEEALDYFDAADRERIRALFEASVERGESFDGEFRVVDAHGLTRWVRVAARPILNGAGEVMRVRGAVQDIGGHKEAERRLDESLQAWRRLAESMPMVVWSCDDQGRLDYVSPRFGEYVGPASTGLGVDGWTKLLHRDDRALVRAAWARALESAERYECEYRIRRHDGEYRWHLSRAQRVQHQIEGRFNWYGTTVDIHDHVVLENRMKVMASRYELVLDSVTDAVVGLDEKWQVTVVNAQAEALLNLRREQLLGHVIWDAFPEARGSRFQLEYERCIRDRVVVRFEEPFLPLGKLFEVTAYPSAGGGVTVYFRDVTEARRLDAQLRQVQRLESIGQLTGSVAHDFNNLLTVVMGNAEQLSVHLPEGSMERELAQTVLEAANRGASMTQRLLAFARKQALSPQPVDVNRLLMDMDQLLRQAAGENVQIDFVQGAGLRAALVDPGQLENALLNLVINARDAMPLGGHLLIETAKAWLDSDYAELNPGVKEGDYVLVCVTDTGHGMDAGVMQQMFEPFFTTKPKGRGTGLGLSMVHGFVKQSNGHIAVYSELGHGTAIRIYLPRIDSAEVRSGRLQDVETPMGHGECVLLVEDDELVRQYAMTLLIGLGYEVVVAHDGHQALHQLQQHPEVQLLFTDVVMPGGIGGRELADLVQKLRPGLPVLYTSGYTDNGIVHQGRLDPDLLLLAKPYRRSELAKRVRQALTAR